MNKKNLLVSILLAGLGATAAVPVVSNVTTTQNASRRVTVNYTLSEEPGIVTLTAQTNRGDNVWVDVGDENLTFVSGDVNKVVPVGDHSLTWLPHKSWPDQLITGGNIRIGVKAWAKDAPPDYMAVSLSATGTVRYYASAEAVPFGVTNDLYKTEMLLMRKIPAANVEWRMGSPTTEVGRTGGRETPHVVALADDYYIGVYPVTQRQYQLLMNARPAYFSLESEYATRPVERVSYDDLRGVKANGYDWPKDGHAVKADGFIGRLRAQTGLDGFDLPTEAQWEFACRAGCGSALYNGLETGTSDSSANLNPLARYANNGGRPNGTVPGEGSSSEVGTAKVGCYQPNAWGLYDMLGNVWEWCLDWYQESPVGFDVATGPASGSARMYRGGSWYNAAGYCRCAARYSIAPSDSYHNIGFRIACTAGDGEAD